MANPNKEGQVQKGKKFKVTIPRNKANIPNKMKSYPHLSVSKVETRRSDNIKESKTPTNPKRKKKEARKFNKIRSR